MALARTIVRGVVWTTFSSTLVRVFGIVGTMLIVRTLSQHDYGVVMDTVNIMLSATAFTTLGVGTYLLVYRDEGPAVSFHATLVHVGLGVVATIVVFALQHDFARWFKAPGLEHYLVGLAVAALIDRVAHVPERLLTRQLQFVLVSNIRTLGEIAFSVTSVVMALTGFGPIALVYGTVARSVVKLVLTLYRVPRRDWLEVVPLDGAIFRRLLVFGAKTWPQTLSAYAVTRWDNFFVTSYYGASVLAEYNLAYNFAEMPVYQVGEQMTDLLMPSFSTLAPERRPTGVLRALGLVSLVMIPIGLGLGAVAKSAIAVAINRPEWSGMAPMLSVLALLSVFRPMSGVLSSYLNAQGRPGLTVMLESFSLVVMLAMMATVARISPLFACVASISTFGVRAILNMWVVGRLDKLPFTSYLAQIVPTLLACVPMILAVLGVRHGLQRIGVASPLVSLILEILAGGAAFVVTTLTLTPRIARDFIDTARAALQKRRET